MSFTTDVSVTEPREPVQQVITTATVPESMSDLPWDSADEERILFPFHAEGPYSELPAEPAPDWLGSQVSPFVVSDNDA